MRFRRWAGASLAIVTGLLGRSTGIVAQVPAPTRCAVGIPQSEASGYVPLPRGDVFCPLLADPKGQRSFVSYLHETSDQGDINLGSVGISDAFALLRIGGPKPGDGFQISLAGSVFAQFDLDSSSYDLVNADYIIGLPMTFRRQAFSMRFRLYHQSSHLGDEFLLRENNPKFVRENISFEAAEMILSLDGGPFRLYGGGEYLLRRDPKDLERYVAHGGIELRPARRLVRFGTVAGVRFVAGGDVKASEEQDWKPAVSVRTGFEFDRPRDTDPPGRRWGLLFEAYTGPSPYGQFFRNQVRYFGAGIHFTL
jgi:Protein of unknown function (DUF1207)